ncbi:MAG: 4a-hydroxytetrahydrobiopterin dehydratase [Terriglobales bacterium]
MDTVDEQELRTALANRLSQWKHAGKTLERQFEFPDFRVAMGFINQVAEKAEEMNHHPDITISYNKVKMSLSSHDAGGITRRDLMLAGKINELAPQWERRKSA